MQPKPPAKTLDAVIAESLRDNQFVSLQDTAHGSAAVRDGLIGMIPVLARNGVKHLFVEVQMHSDSPQHSQQRHMDAFMEGDITSAALERFFVENPSNYYLDKYKAAQQQVKLLEVCKQHGIRVWASDPGTLKQRQAVVEKHPGAMDYYRTYLAGKSVTGNSMTLDPASPVVRDLVVEFLPELINCRIANNKSVVEFAVSKARDRFGLPEKAAFFWGGGHSSNYIGAVNIDEYAGKLDNGPGEQVTNIAILPSRAAKSMRTASGQGEDVHYFYFAMEKEIASNVDYTEVPVFEGIGAYKKHQKDLLNKGLIQL